jgi:hypothetical protein
MPRVPVYEQQVQQAPLPDARVNLRTTPEDFGAGVAQGGEHLAAGLHQAALDEKRKTDTARAMDATATMDSWDDLAIYDPDKGALNTRKGKDAVGVTDEYMKARADAVAATRAGLANDEQRLAFDRVQERKSQVIFHTLSSHQAHENDLWAKQQTGAVAETASSNAANAAAAGPLADPATSKALDLARQQVVDSITAAARPGGALAGEGDPNDPASPAGRMLRQSLTSLHLGVLDRLTDQKRITEAKAYLEAHKGEIDGVALGKSKVNEVLAAGVAADEARREADRIWAEAKGDPAKAGELTRAIKDTTLFDAVDKRIKARVAEDHALDAAADAPRIGRLEVAIDRTGGLDRLSKDYVTLSDEGKARVEAKYLANKRQRRAEGSEERRQQAAIDAQARLDFDTLPLKGEQGKDQLTADIAALFPNVSDVGAAALRLRQKKAAAEWEKDQGVTSQQFDQRADAVAQQLGYDPKTTAKQFRTYLRDQRDAWLAENPTRKAPPDDVVRKMLADAILFGDEGGWHLTRNRYAWQKLQAGEPFEAFPEGEQPANVKAALAKLRGGAPAAAESAPAPTAARPRRTVNGETREWDGKAWVPVRG